MGKLDGKIALITGGSRGIGGATARILASEGARVVLVADATYSTGTEFIIDGGSTIGQLLDMG